MAAPITFKYRAFLSYAHADTRWARRLHRRLEAFRIDKDLIGRPTAHGAVPATLRPIFRDRDDFTAGHALTDQTVAALDASAALIVLCSPASAKSHYVNEEIRLFKSRHPDRPVISVIVDGTPGDPERECFAPALRFKVTADGTVTDIPDDELAADVRESGDGFDRALAKVVARLLDLATDDVFRRAERARRRSANIRNGIIAALALLAISTMGSAVYAWHLLRTNEAFLEATLKEATEIVNTAVSQAEKYNVPRTATLEFLTRAERLFDNMARLGRPTPELRRQKAWMLIQFARNYEILGDTTKQRERADEAHRIMAALAADTGDDLATLRDLSVGQDERGDVFVAQGDLPEALRVYRDSLGIRNRLAKADPGNAFWQGDLSVSYDKIGNVLVAQGNLPEALASYRDGLAIAERLATADPGNADWQRSLLVSYRKVGDMQVAQGDFDQALTPFHASLAIADRFAKADPGNAGWQRELSVSYQRVGNVLVAQGNLPAALRSFGDSHTIFDRLARADPHNAGWQRDLSVSYNKVGDVLVAQGSLDQAIMSYRASLAIADRLAKSDPGNTVWQRDLSVSHSKVGEVLVAQGNLPEALTSFRDSLAIAARLAKTDPSNVGWQADLAASHGQRGQLHVALGDKAEAMRLFKAGRAIIAPFAENTRDQHWIGYLRSFDAEIAALEK
jgi:tetratricopeptide (TPR) repeat protein